MLYLNNLKSIDYWQGEIHMQCFTLPVVYNLWI